MDYNRWLVLFLQLGVPILISYASSICDDALGLDERLPNNRKTPDDQISASSEDHYTNARFGRLRMQVARKNFGVWCPKPEEKHPWFQVDYGHMVTTNAVATATNDFIYAYVKTYTLMFSYDGIIWYDILDEDTNLPKTFIGVKDLYKQNKVEIEPPITARYFRIYPQTKEHKFCLKAEFYGCLPEKDCSIPVGIADKKKFQKSQFTASSSYDKHYPNDARLNNSVNLPLRNWGAWCAETTDTKPWLEVDMEETKEIAGVSTQGHPLVQMDSWTEEFKLNYSINRINWIQYNKTFIGNRDSNSIKHHVLDNKISARYIRFIPLKWKNIPCFRVEAYQCLPREDSIPKLSEGIKDTTIERGETFKLTCKFTGQPGIMLVWYLNGGFLPTDNRISTKYNKTNSSVTSTLLFQRIKGSEDGASFSCLAWYPMLEKIFSKSSAVITVIAPEPTLSLGNHTATTISLQLGIKGPVTKDVVGYVLRFNSHYGGEQIEITKFNRTLVYENTKLTPYTNYTVDIAMLYIEDEVGIYYDKRKFKTLQDRPYGAPLSFEVTKISHDVLYCEWEPPSHMLQNGPITSYEIRYFESVKKIENPVFNYKIVNTTTSAYLRDLEAGASYEVTVRAYTKIGSGPYVHPPVMIYTGKATEELNAIKELVINEGNAAAVGNRLQNITANPNFLNKHDVELTIDILEKVVSVQNKSELLGDSLVKAVSNVLKANKTVLQESEITNKTGTRYVKMLEKWLENVESEDKELEENSENVIVRKIFLNKLTLEEGIKFAEASNEITIPKEALPTNDTNESIYFVYYKNDKFFVEKTVIEELCIDGFTVLKERTYTPVISGDIVGKKTQNLSTPVVLKFKADEKTDLHESACVYWDFKADNSKGGWSKEGCKVQSIVNQTIVCHCNHLTNFAAMMDVYAHTSRTCGIHQDILSYISIIGCFLSIVGLFLTFLTYFMFRRLLKEMAAKVLVQLCLALFVVIITFVTGIEQVQNKILCTSVAVILHYFTLVVFMWMFMEAMFMYHAFVRVWPPREGGDIKKSTIVAWGIPLLIVLVTFLTRMNEYGGKHYCHVTGYALYVAYLGPIGFIIFINLTVFMFIMHRLSSRPSKTTDKSNIHIAMIRVRRAFGIMLLMGLTWAFGFGTASSARLEFSYLFSVCNALQGFAIFVFYCLAQKNARNAWYRFITCDSRSDLKRNTDSYYERRRMSSTASNRTNTLPFNRGYSNASSLYHNNSFGNAANNSLSQISNLSMDISTRSVPMNTITEVDSPSPTRKHDNPLMRDIMNDCKLTSIDGLSQDSAEDEILNLKLQEAEDARKKHDIKLDIKHDIKQYSSYRALSGATSYDVLNLTKTPSAKCLTKDNFLMRKSSENINKKRKSNDNRKSLHDPYMSDTSMVSSMRTAKSLEHINKKQLKQSEIPVTQELGLTSYNKIDSRDNITQKDTLLSNHSTLTHESDDINKKLLNNNSFNDAQNPLNDNNGTLKSDACTMTDTLLTRDILQKDTPKKLLPPLYDLKRSQENIINWLHECGTERSDDEKGTDSDYSSSYYKTSRSSSMTDLSLPIRKNYSNNKDHKFLDNTIMGPLKGHQIDCYAKKNKDDIIPSPSARSSLLDQDKDLTEASELSELGYSASEEDVFEKNFQSYNNKQQKRKKSKNRSRSLVRDYITLEDEPTSQMSYV